MKQHSESGFFSSPDVAAESAGLTGVEPLYESQAGWTQLYVARHFGRRVVLKTIKKSDRNNLVARAQLEKEFTLGFRVDSPFICRTLGRVTLPDGRNAIEMEFCDGVSLDKLTDLHNDEMRALVRQLLMAVEALHTVGVAHRDLKPSNIIYDPRFHTLRVIDFGCADSADALTLKAPAGTRCYTRPQQCDADSAEAASGADDLFSVGMIVLELAGRGNNSDRELQRFGKQLIEGRYSTAAAALTGLESMLSRRKNRMLLAAVAIALFAASAFGLSYYNVHVRDTMIPEVSEPAVEAIADEDVAGADDYAFAVDTLSERVAGGKASERELHYVSVEQSANHMTSDVLEPTEETTAGEDLDEYAFAAGPLFEKVAGGIASEREVRDAFVMQCVDSIYIAPAMLGDLEKYGIVKAETVEYGAVSSRFCKENAAEILRRYTLRFGSIDDKERILRLVTARCNASLRVYSGVYYEFK